MAHGSADELEFKLFVHVLVGVQNRTALSVSICEGHRARRKQDAVRVQGIFFVVGRFSAKASAPLLPISLLLRSKFSKSTLSLSDAAICCAPLSRTSFGLILRTLSQYGGAGNYLCFSKGQTVFRLKKGLDEGWAYGALITKGWFPPSFWQPSESPSDANLAFERHPVSSLPYAVVVEDYTTESSQELAASRGERHQKVVCSVSDCRDRLFFFMMMEDSKSETGKACKIFTTLQRNTLCQKSENMVWTRHLFPHWRHDSDSV